MKKYFLIFLVAILIITGCSKKEDKVELPKKIGNEDNVVLIYEEIQASVENSPTYKITLYNDKKLIKGWSHLDGFSTINLSDEFYQEIIDIAFSKEFLGLDKDISSSKTVGGSSYYITLYYDGKVFKTGGTDIQNKYFKELEELLKKH